MKRIAHNGDPLYKRVRVKVFLPGNKKHGTVIYKSQSGKGYHATGIDELLDNIATRLEQVYPGEEYRLVALAPDSFNFVHAGANRSGNPVESSDGSAAN